MNELKRFFALLMCLAIIGGDVRYVGAAEIQNDQSQVIVASEETDIPEAIVEDSKATTEDIEIAPVEETLEEVNNDAGAAPVEEVIEEAESVSANDASLETTEEVISDGPVEEASDELDSDSAVAKVVEDYIDVDDNGTLILKDTEVGIPMATIVIPLIFEHNGEEVYLKAIPDNVFKNNMQVKNISFNPEQESRLVSISANAFYNSSVETFSLPKAHEEKVTVDGKEETVLSEYVVTKICAETFKNSSLKEIGFNGQPIEVIEKGAFQGSHLEHFVGPATLKTIEDEAFSSCDKLVSAKLPNVETIGNDAFQGCKVLGSEPGSLTLSANLKKIGNRAFKSCGFKTLDISNATGITSVGEAVFENCISLTEFTMPSRFPSITDGMFRNCTALVNVLMDENTFFTEHYIGKEAFYGCEALTGAVGLVGTKKVKRIVIPYSVYSIGQRAFIGCTALKTVEIHYSRYYSEDYMVGISINKNAFEEIGRKFTIGGYDRSVEAYANEHRFAFVDLSNPQTVKTSFTHGSGSTNPTKPKSGDEVTLTVKMNSGYTLVPSDNGRFVTFTEIDKDTKEEKPFSASKIDGLGFRLIAVNGSSLTFKFLMPGLSKAGNSLKVAGVLEAVGAHKADEESISFDAETYPESQECTFTPTPEPTLTFNKTGDRAQLKFKDAAGRELGPWKFTFSVPEDSKNVCTVSPEGVVTAKTATNVSGYFFAKNNATGKSHKINVAVKNSVVIKKIDFAVDQSVLPYPFYIYKENRRETVIADKTTGATKVVSKEYTVLELTKSSLAANEYKFAIYAKPHEADSGKVCVVDTTWKQTDKKIATVAKEKSDNCENVITVKKGAVGETEITVTAENPILKPDDPDRVCTGGFVVKIIDDIPKLITSEFNVIVNYSGGYKLPIVVADGYPIENDNLWIAKGKDGATPVSELYVESKNGDFYLKVASSERIAEGKSKTYTGYYLCGEIFTNKFAIPIKSVVASNIVVNNEYTTEGSINLFYNTVGGYDKDRENTGKVILTPTQPIAKVEKYYLFTKENHRLITGGYKRPQDILDDELANNFEIEVFDEVTGGAAITRSSNPIARDADEKMYKTGYLYTMYEGFDKAVVNTITIPTVTIPPKYVFNAPKQVVYKDQKQQDFELMVVDQKTKTLPTITKTGEDGKDYIEYSDPLKYADKVSFDWSSKGTSTGLFDESELKLLQGVEEEFKDPNNAGKKIKISVNKVYLKLAGLPKSGKGVVNIESPEWNQPLKVTVTISSTKSIAKTKLSQKTVTLNNNANQTVGRIKVTTNQTYADIVDADIQYAGSARLASGGETLARNMKFSVSQNKITEGTVTVALPANGSVPKGKYKFKIFTDVEYSSGDVRTLKPVTFTVSVSDALPTLKLKSSKVTLNASYPGTEVNEVKFSLGNMPKGDYALDFSEAKVTPKSKKGDYLERVRTSLSFNFIPKIETENYKKDAVATVGFNKDTQPFGSNFSYQYMVSGVKAIDEDGKVVKLKEFKLTVAGKAVEPKVTTTKKGTINPIDPYTNIVATAKISKIKASISGIDLRELDSANRYVERGQENFYAEIITQEKYDAGYYKRMPNIKVTKGQVAPNQVLIRWKHSQSDQLKEASKYKIQLFYLLDTYEVAPIRSTDIVIKPVQKNPILFAKLIRPNSLNEESLETALYARSSEHSDFITRVVPVSPSTPIVSEIRLDDSTDAKTRRAFELDYYRVEPTKEDKNTYRVCDLTGIVKTVTLDAKKKPVVKVSYNNISYNGISANEIYKYGGKTGEVDPEDIPVDFTDELAIELAKEEVKYRASFLKDQVYMIGNGHYYIHVTLINAAPVTYDKAMNLKIEVRYFNQMKKKAGSKFNVTTTVYR